MKKRASKFEPETYLPSKSDPSYRKEAARYAVRHIYLSPAKQDKRMAKGALLDGQAIIHEADVREMEDDFVDFLTGLIEKGWQSAPIGKGHATFSDEHADYVIKAIRIFGLDALRLSPLDEPIVRGQDSSDSRLTGLTRKDQLGASVCNAIRYWHDQVRKGSIEERRRAREHLKKVCDALIPDSRGNRGNNLTVPRLGILLYYYNKMFDLYHVKNTLRSGSGDRNSKVVEASQNFGIPAEQIREFWGLDEKGEPKRLSGPFTIKDMARESTCRHFKITHQTLLNIIASFPP